MTELIHVLPVLNIEVMDASDLPTVGNKQELDHNTGRSKTKSNITDLFLIAIKQGILTQIKHTTYLCCFSIFPSDTLKETGLSVVVVVLSSL